MHIFCTHSWRNFAPFTLVANFVSNFFRRWFGCKENYLSFKLGKKIKWKIF